MGNPLNQGQLEVKEKKDPLRCEKTVIMNGQDHQTNTMADRIQRGDGPFIDGDLAQAGRWHAFQ